MENGFLRRSTFLLSVITIGILLLTSEVKALLPVPVLTCVSVEDNGSLTVNWNIPAGTFEGFRIFYQRNDQSISNSIDAPNTSGSVNITGIDAQTYGYRIYMVTYENSQTPPVSEESDFMNSMFLSFSNTVSDPGLADLKWISMRGGVAHNYRIFRSEDNINFTQIGITPDLTYQDTITFPYCDENNPTTLYYRVEFWEGVCQAKSSTAIGEFYDTHTPEDPVISFVTIHNGLAEINWTPSPSVDLGGYVLGVKEGNQFPDHATTGVTDMVIDNFTTHATYHNPCTEVVTYVLRAEDLCGNQSSGAINYQHPHNTILIDGETAILCDRKATLAWNAYNNMIPPVSVYIVMRTQNGGAPVEVGSIQANGDPQYTFVDPEILTPGDGYTYTIVAISEDNTKMSQSCEILLIPNPEPISVFEMDYLTVVDNDHIEISVDGAPASLISTIEVSRSSVDGESVQLLFSAPWNGVSPVMIPDESALVNETSYYYSITALDDCGFELASTNTFRSIYLQIQDQGNDQYRLSWNAYEDWGNALLEYNLFRVADGVVESGFPVILSPSQLAYNDLAGNLVANRTTYYVEAVRNDDIRSMSNEVLLPADAEVLIPNAFRPNGITAVFKPRVKNIEQGSYLFAIYNRWGQLVFDTNNFDEGWNGTFKGNAAPGDIYAWIITYVDLTGNKTSKRGSVILLR